MGTTAGAASGTGSGGAGAGETTEGADGTAGASGGCTFLNPGTGA